MYFIKWILLFCLTSALFVPGSTASAQTQAAFSNVLQVNFISTNNPVVTVTVCVPGTNNCSVIPNVQLDSGSNGLRLFSSAITAPLPKIPNPDGSVSASCSTFGDGGSAWGPIVNADVILGGDRAINVPVRLMDATFASIPTGCANVYSGPSSMFGNNGILGIGTIASKFPAGFIPPQGDGQYACLGANCTLCTQSNWTTCAANFLQMRQDLSPIKFMSVDNNGWILQLPSVSPLGSATLTGILTLGLGTQANNQVPTGLSVFPLDDAGTIAMQFQGQNYSTILDTGTSAWVLPAPIQGVPFCTDFGGSNISVFCPNTPLSLQATFLNNSVTPATQYTFSFQLVNHQTWTAGAAVNNLGVVLLNSPELPKNFFITGIPFFMGRTVYCGIKGAQTPLGVGPFNAF